MALLTCEWNKLAFANYIVPPEILKNHLPADTELDYFNGNCFVSLVGFQFRNVKIAGVKVPFHTNFEEINLRFYVKKKSGTGWRKGTVFIQEIADKTALAVLANGLFHENYKILPTRQEVLEEEEVLKAAYFFKFEEDWQHIKLLANSVPSPVETNSETEFILHRLWGYGKHKNSQTNEYRISHPHWQTYGVKDHEIQVDFSRVFGPEFSILNSAVPNSVILAEGSHVQLESLKKMS